MVSLSLHETSYKLLSWSRFVN